MAMSQGELIYKRQQEAKRFLSRQQTKDCSTQTLITQAKASLYMQPQNRTPTSYGVPFANCITTSITANPTPSGTFTSTFTYTGEIQTWTVPENVTQITVYLWGAGGRAQGGIIAGAAGSGAFSQATLGVNPGDVLQIIIGSGVYPINTTLSGGGGSLGGEAADGGGFTGIFNASPTQGSALLIAGGGGGSGYGGGGFGGGGGWPDGLNGTGVSAGFGGTCCAGGLGCVNGSALQGGGGGSSCAGGGGGGYWGGGSGNRATLDGAGGGGGSSYVTTAALASLMLNGFTGNGSTNPTPAPNTSSPYYQGPYGQEGQDGFAVIRYDLPATEPLVLYTPQFGVNSGTTTFNQEDAVVQQAAGRVLCCQPDYSLFNGYSIDLSGQYVKGGWAYPLPNQPNTAKVPAALQCASCLKFYFPNPAQPSLCTGCNTPYPQSSLYPPQPIDSELRRYGEAGVPRVGGTSGLPTNSIQ